MLGETWEWGDWGGEREGGEGWTGMTFHDCVARSTAEGEEERLDYRKRRRRRRRGKHPRSRCTTHRWYDWRPWLRVSRSGQSHVNAVGYVLHPLGAQLALHSHLPAGTRSDRTRACEMVKRSGGRYTAKVDGGLSLDHCSACALASETRRCVGHRRSV